MHFCVSCSFTHPFHLAPIPHKNFFSMPQPMSFIDWIDELRFKRSDKKHSAIKTGLDTQQTSEASSKDKQPRSLSASSKRFRDLTMITVTSVLTPHRVVIPSRLKSWAWRTHGYGE